MVSRTEVILFARQALLPAKAYPFSKFPLKALYKAVTIQYGLRDILHVLIQLKGQAFGCLIPAFTFSRKLQWMARPGMPTGLLMISMSFSSAYIGLFEGFRGIAFRGGNEPGS